MPDLPSDALRGTLCAALVVAVLAGVPAIMHHVCIRRLRRRFQAHQQPDYQHRCRLDCALGRSLDSVPVASPHALRAPTLENKR